MSTKFKFGPITIDAQAYGSQGNAVLGIRDSGKSYTATELAEKLFDAGVPFVAFDPTGVWRFLRVPGKGHGYPIVVAGGKSADLPLTVTGAVEIVRAAMKNGVSLVLDLTDPAMSKANWRAIVKSCVRVLLQENADHGLRHIFFEEAAEFVPQRVLDGDVYAEVEKLARIGGNSRLGYTLINQRSQEVNKAVLELCENLFLHRQKGKNAIQSLDHWLGVAGVDQVEIVKSLPNLPSGSCWAWMGDRAAPTLVEVPPKNSFHPDRRTMHGATAGRSRKAVDVGSFVQGMRAALVDLEKEAAASDPKALRAEIVRLNRLLAEKSKTVPAAKPDTSALEEAERRGFAQAERKLKAAAEREVKAAQINILGVVAERLRPLHDLLAEELRKAKGEKVKLEIAYSAAPAAVVPRAMPSAPPRMVSRAKPATPSGGGADGPLPAGEKTVLIAVAQYPEGAEREQLTVLTGYKRSSRDTYLQRLGARGYVEFTGGRILATQQGVDALGNDYEPLPTGLALQEYWIARLPEGERRVLGILIEAFPDDVDRDAISEATGYKRSSRDTYLQRLGSRRLVTSERGTARASGLLFDSAAAA